MCRLLVIHTKKESLCIRDQFDCSIFCTIRRSHDSNSHQNQQRKLKGRQSCSHVYFFVTRDRTGDETTVGYRVVILDLVAISKIRFLDLTVDE